MVNRRRYQSNPLPKYLIVLGVLVAGCTLTYGIVRAAGWLDQTAPLSQEPSREGMVPIPKSLVNLRAFDVVQREDVYDRTLGDDSYFWLPETTIQNHPEWFTRADQIIGRVMARDKRADFVFSEKDFLPEGSRSGIAGGVPTGKQGFFIEAEKVPGLRFLKKGDRFDLLASLPDESKNSTSEYGLLMGGIKARGGKAVPLNGVTILAQNAEMIALTTSRVMTTQGGLQLNAKDSRGRTTSNPKDERVAIAIDPTEAVPLTKALGESLEIHMVTRSGQNEQNQIAVDLLEGRIAVAATAVPIDSFQAIKASDLAEPTSGELRQYFFEPNDVQDDWIIRPEALIGRVVSRPIEPGYIFSESDFLPPGSLTVEVNAYEEIDPEFLVEGVGSQWSSRVAARDLSAGSILSEKDVLPEGSTPGLASAIPSDRMALTLDPSVVNGMAKLSQGDRCDLVSSTSLQYENNLRGVKLSPSVMNSLRSEAVNRVLASNALVIENRKDNVVVALRPIEASSVAKALATKTSLFCITRSGERDAQPSSPHSAGDETINELVSDPDPLAEIAISETLIGGKRTVRAFRRGP